MNDPVALLLVIGFIEWIQKPGYGVPDMARAAGAETGGRDRRRAGAGRGSRPGSLERIELPSEGLYPVATIAVAGLAYGVSELIGGSGLLAVYLTALALGDRQPAGRRIVVTFHEGVGWIAQIALFILLGLLVFPSDLGDVALKGLALSAVLILVARPAGDLPGDRAHPVRRAREGDARLGRAARGDADLARHLPGRGRASASGEEIFAIVFFVVVTSTLIQGASFEPLAKRLGLTTDEPALPQRLLRVGADPADGRRRDRLPPARGRGGGRPPGARPGAAARGAGQRHRPRRAGDRAARLDRARGGRRAPHPGPRRAAARRSRS